MSNPFSLLTDEGADPADNVPTPAPAKAAPAASAPSAARTQPKQQQPRRDNNRGNARTNAPVQGTDAGEADLSRDVRGERTAGQRGGRGSGARGPRGGRGGRGSGANRPMDRHSNTDRVDSHKQEHQAWGGDEGKRELSDENEGLKDAQAAVSGVATPVGDGTSTPVPAQAEAEPEDNTKTYQEWLAEQKKANIGGDLPQARQANEGADDAQWKDAVAIKKDEDDDVLFAQTKEGKARKQRAQKEKTYIEFEPQYPRPGQSDRGRGGARGARGGDRGGRGRGGDRGGRGSSRGAPRSNGPRSSQAAPNTTDASAFPSLS